MDIFATNLEYPTIQFIKQTGINAFSSIKSYTCLLYTSPPANLPIKNRPIPPKARYRLAVCFSI